jgi:tetratricopeptide (TPR) repeat protein
MALLHYQKAVKIDPELSPAWLGIGVVYDLNESYIESLFFIKKALELESNNPEFWYIYGDVLYRAGQLDEAVNAYQRTSELEKDNFEVLLDLALVYYELGDIEGLTDTIAAAVTTFGIENPAVAYRYAAFCFITGKNKEGLTILEGALEKDYEGHEGFLEFEPTFKLNTTITNLIGLHNKQ